MLIKLENKIEEKSTQEENRIKIDRFLYVQLTCSSSLSLRRCVCSSNLSTYSRNSSISSFTCCTVSNSCLIATISRLTCAPCELQVRARGGEKNNCSVCVRLRWPHDGRVRCTISTPLHVARQSTHFGNFTLATLHRFRQLLQLRSDLAKGNCGLHVAIAPLELI